VHGLSAVLGSLVVLLLPMVTRCLGYIRSKDLLVLVGVIQVVRLVKADDVLHGLCTTLGMNPLVLPLLRRQGHEQRNVHIAEHAEDLDGFTRIALVVVPGDNPCVLIKCLYRGSRRRQNRPAPPTCDDLRISKMREDLGDRPLSRPGALAQPGRRCALDQALEFLGGLRLDVERILSTHIGQNALDVLLGSFLHWSIPSVNTLEAPSSRACG